MDKKKKLRYNGFTYRVSPIYLIWENDCYYLVCYYPRYNTISRFRVDRMSEVAVTENKRKALTLDEEEMAKQLRSTYNMFGGRTETVTLLMDGKLMNVLIDKFGESVRVSKVDDTHFSVKLEVQISPTFWGWLFQFGDQAKILAPKSVIDEAKQELTKMLNCYE